MHEEEKSVLRYLKLSEKVSLQRNNYIFNALIHKKTDVINLQKKIANLQNLKICKKGSGKPFS